MLNLQVETPDRWLNQVDEDLDQVLLDHAHCELSAARTALNLMVAYVLYEPLTVEMTRIINEELDHFHQVLEQLNRLDIDFKRQQSGHYGKRLNALVRSEEPMRGVDRLLIAALIEARSCERFCLLRDHVRDPELADFYGSLFESEAGHYATYVQLAKDFMPSDEVDQRLDELASEEAQIILEGYSRARMHS
ncbi:MAG TPA: tRNA hydroxylase [Planctomycetaceae bacterium]|nr:tRNA-(ms[2]io[6]A)-hydroxylase [Pirellulales bacterium]HCK70234.1 tRNA hydroxylase [Planctomycetaceae bacterium]HCP82993.1 tRNA hydroxylase [Planctomycetaceae bacterium]